MTLPIGINLIGATPAELEAVVAKLLAVGQTMYNERSITYRAIMSHEGEWSGDASSYPTYMDYREFLRPPIDFHF